MNASCVISSVLAWSRSIRDTVRNTAPNSARKKTEKSSPMSVTRRSGASQAMVAAVDCSRTASAPIGGSALRAGSGSIACGRLPLLAPAR